MKRHVIIAAAALSVLAGCAGSKSEVSHSKNHSAPPATQPAAGAPLFDDLGDYTYPITTTSPRAQRYFDQGLILAYAFNHAEAVRSFEEAGRLDPNCAMAFWGVALALGPNINAPMEASAHEKAVAALRTAQELAPKVSQKEQDFIAALSARYTDQHAADRAPLDKAYADAMRELAKKHPDDLDAQTLMAESIMDTSPWNYWTVDLKPREGTANVLAALEGVLAKNPNHPGACHLYIHATEAGPTPAQSLAAADRLRDLVPGAGHLVHMPSHIYLRVGQYAEASWANEQAIHADESYLDQCAAQGFYPAMYYPHNVHFLWYSAAMEGRSAASIDAAKKAAAHQLKICCGAEAPRQRPLPLLAALRFGKWDDVLGYDDWKPGEEHPFDQAAWHYARGIAHAMKNQPADAATELTTLEQIAASEKAKAMDSPYLPATQVLQTMIHELTGEIAMTQGKTDDGIAALKKAVETEDALPYMEPPYYHYPVRHVLGAALLKAHRAAEAEQTYREDLKKHPNNGWALFGLAQSLRAQGKAEPAAEVQRQFEQSFMRADVKLTSSRY